MQIYFLSYFVFYFALPLIFFMLSLIFGIRFHNNNFSFCSCCLVLLFLFLFLLSPVLYYFISYFVIIVVVAIVAFFCCHLFIRSLTRSFIHCWLIFLLQIFFSQLRHIWTSCSYTSVKDKQATLTHNSEVWVGVWDDVDERYLLLCLSMPVHVYG